MKLLNLLKEYNTKLNKYFHEKRTYKISQMLETVKRIILFFFVHLSLYKILKIK
jgi:flagellar biosynthesis protein FlhB